MTNINFSEDELIYLKNNLLHLSIIIDGNGRWANSMGVDRSEGHNYGAETLKKIAQEVFYLGIKYLSIFGFSTENWNRPLTEVNHLMHLINKTLTDEVKNFKENKIKVSFIGNIKKLPKYLLETISLVEDETKHNNTFFLIIALNYSGKWEITNAIQDILDNSRYTEINYKLDDLFLKNFLQTKNIPDPDFLIRTGGELRLSNFMLYQLAYTELFFIKKNWPDFSIKDLHLSLKNFLSRSRRFGTLNK